MIQISSFCWLHMALAVGFVVVVWLLTWLFFFRHLGRDSPPLDHRWEKDVEEFSGEEELMGKSVLEAGVSIVSAEDFSFADRQAQSGEVQQEIREICRILAEKDGSKEDFFSMFLLVREKFPWAASSALVPELNVFIRSCVPFYLSEAELESLWD